MSCSANQALFFFIPAMELLGNPHSAGSLVQFWPQVFVFLMEEQSSWCLSYLESGRLMRLCSFKLLTRQKGLLYTRRVGLALTYFVWQSSLRLYQIVPLWWNSELTPWCFCVCKLFLFILNSEWASRVNNKKEDRLSYCHFNDEKKVQSKELR